AQLELMRALFENSGSPGARTFLSDATSECRTVRRISEAFLSFDIAADKNVRAPVQLLSRRPALERAKRKVRSFVSCPNWRFAMVFTLLAFLPLTHSQSLNI